MSSGVDLHHRYTDSIQYLVAAGEDPDYLDGDVSDVWPITDSGYCYG